MLVSKTHLVSLTFSIIVLDQISCLQSPQWTVNVLRSFIMEAERDLHKDYCARQFVQLLCSQQSDNGMKKV